MSHFQVEGLANTFGTTRALDGVDLRWRRGPFGLLGPNGAGKTTGGPDLGHRRRPDRRPVPRLYGYDVACQPQQVRQLIGLTGQYAAVDEPLSVTENLSMLGRLLGLGKAQASQRAADHKEDFDLADVPVAGWSRPTGVAAAAPRPGGQPGRPAAGAVPGQAERLGWTPWSPAMACGRELRSWSPRGTTAKLTPSSWRMPTTWPDTSS